MKMQFADPGGRVILANRVCGKDNRWSMGLWLLSFCTYVNQFTWRMRPLLQPLFTLLFHQPAVHRLLFSH